MFFLEVIFGLILEGKFVGRFGDIVASTIDITKIVIFFYYILNIVVPLCYKLS